jgi:hypothetical protein
MNGSVVLHGWRRFPTEASGGALCTNAYAFVASAFARIPLQTKGWNCTTRRMYIR